MAASTFWEHWLSPTRPTPTRRFGVQQVVTHTWRATGENCTAPPKQTQGRWLLSNHVSTTCWATVARRMRTHCTCTQQCSRQWTLQPTHSHPESTSLDKTWKERNSGQRARICLSWWFLKKEECTLLSLWLSETLTSADLFIFIYLFFILTVVVKRINCSVTSNIFHNNLLSWNKF